MAKTSTAVEAGIAADPKTQGKTTPQGDHDRVVMASRRPDGTPAQTEDFEFIGPRDFAIKAAQEQRAQQAVSAVDVAIRGVTTSAQGEGNEGSSEPDPAVSEIKAAHDKAADAARKEAEKEVESRHAGLGD